MHRARVKICGVRTLEEARAALVGGADALGFNFWAKSPRYVTPQTAADITRQLPPFINFVGVFVNEDAARINEIIKITGISTVQLHGDEEAEFVAQLDAVKIIKAFRVGEAFDVGVLKSFPADAFLLDAKVKGEYGGTGQRFDWRIAAEAQKLTPIVLAGGLTAENIAEAITTVRPFAIDVCSGVEAAPGRKDLRKMREFFLAVEKIGVINQH